MNEDSFFYPTGGNLPPTNTQMQYLNSFPVQQPPVSSWSTNYSSPLVSGPPNLCYNASNPTPGIEENTPLFTPVSSAMYGTTSTCSWAQKVPNLMPWIPTGEPTTVSDPVVRFSAPFHPDPCTSQTATQWEIVQNLSSPHKLYLKRKCELDDLDVAPQKICVTEEKMAARFQQMHISNQYMLPAKCSDNSFTVKDPVAKPVTNLQQLEIMLQDSNSSSAAAKSLILAPEIKKLVEPEKILKTFLSKVEKPSMALMLWQPPNQQLLERKADSEQTSEPTNNETSENNNNNLSPAQLNQYLSSYVSQGNQCQTTSEDGMETQ